MCGADGITVINMVVFLTVRLNRTP
jgi:hypothetical protein